MNLESLQYVRFAVLALAYATNLKPTAGLIFIMSLNNSANVFKRTLQMLINLTVRAA